MGGEEGKRILGGRGEQKRRTEEDWKMGKKESDEIGRESINKYM